MKNDKLRSAITVLGDQFLNLENFGVGLLDIFLISAAFVSTYILFYLFIYFFAQYIFSHQFEIISLGAFEHGCKILARNWARFPKKPILGRLTNSFQNIFAQYKNKKMLKT